MMSEKRFKVCIDNNSVGLLDNSVKLIFIKFTNKEDAVSCKDSLKYQCNLMNELYDENEQLKEENEQLKEENKKLIEDWEFSFRTELAHHRFAEKELQEKIREKQATISALKEENIELKNLRKYCAEWMGVKEENLYDVVR